MQRMQRPDTVELVIGYHLLEGKMVDLKKPFAILEKQAPAFCSGGDDMDVDVAHDAQGSVEYKVERPALSSFRSSKTAACWQR